MSNIDPRTLARAVRAARADAAPDDRRTRVRAAVSAALAAAPIAPRPPANAAPSPSPPPAPPVPGPAGIALGKAIAGAALVGAIGFAAGFATGRGGASHAPPAQRSPAAIATIPAATRTPAPDLEIDVDLPAPSVTATAAIPAARASQGASQGARTLPAASGSIPDGPPTAGDGEAGSSLAGELALLREARRALREGDPARSLRWIDELEVRHPRGVLAEERSAARILALCAAGRAGEARSLAARFVAAHPRSLQIEAIRASCAAP